MLEELGTGKLNISIDINGMIDHLLTSYIHPTIADRYCDQIGY